MTGPVVGSDTLDLRHLIMRCPECGEQFSPDAVFCPFDGGKLEAGARAAAPEVDPLMGQTVDGRYLVESVLGEGGMGTVYRVRHAALGRAFALKVLRSDLATDAELSARFLQEAQATAAVKHPNVVAINDFGTLNDGRPYFVMELLEGVNLAQLVKAGPLGARRAAQVALKVAAGLDAAHRAGVVHRDLKPENVFLQAPAAAAQGAAAEDDVRVVDFGAAIILGKSRLTKKGVIYGTPFYMAPEQAAGRPVDHRADVYALGVILYEAFTGRVPFEGDTYMGVLTQHLYVQPTPPSQLVPALAHQLGPLEEVTLRALEKDPERRFATMEVFADAIAAALEGIAPPSTRPSRAPATPLELGGAGDRRSHDDAWDQPVPPAGRLRILVPIVAAVAALAVLLGVGLALRHWRVAVASSPSTSVAAPATIAPSSPAASSAPPAPRVVVVRSTVPADAYEGGALLGRTPVDVEADPGAPARIITLKAEGYAEQDVRVDEHSEASLQVELRKLVRPHPHPAATASHRSSGGGFQDPWATK